MNKTYSITAKLYWNQSTDATSEEKALKEFRVTFKDEFGFELQDSEIVEIYEEEADE